MKLIDILLLAGVALLVGGALYVLRKNGRGCCGKGSCEGSCGACGKCGGHRK